MRPDTTPREAAAILTAMAIADAIRDLGQVPAGHLYAQVMSRMTLDTFEIIVSALVGAGLVRRGGDHMLTWIGPTATPKPGCAVCGKPADVLRGTRPALCWAHAECQLCSTEGPHPLAGMGPDRIIDGVNPPSALRHTCGR